MIDCIAPCRSLADAPALVTLSCTPIDAVAACRNSAKIAQNVVEHCR
jgi:hypothetical protein